MPSAVPPVVVPGSPAPPPVVGEVPWEKRRELGLWRAFWQTWIGSLGSDTFWRSVSPTAPKRDALFYAWLVSAVGAVLSIPTQILQVRSQPAPAMPPNAGELPPNAREWIEQMLRLTEWFRENAVEWTVGSALVTIVLTPLLLAITAGLVHLCLLIFGAAKDGFGATFRIVSYSRSPLLLMFIPVVNMLAGLYVIALMVWGVSRVHGVSVGRAAAAILIPFVLLTCCICCGGFTGMIAMMSAR